MGFLLGDQVALQRGDAVLAEEGGEGAAPEIPEEVEVFGLSFVEGAHDDLFDLVEEEPPAIGMVVDGEGEVFALGIDGDAAVEDQALVAHQVHAPAADDILDVFPQLLAVHERFAHALHAGLFIRREFVGVGRVDGGEMGVEQLVCLPINVDGAGGVVDAVHQAAVVHFPLRIAGDHFE